ncbi:CRAL/TRIO domain-containing protein [Lindgomyces ingoldianus]|uniref:CRAL/TRIO domain-containing protein n=1 Tax=Lindgomyces ingoldianus TaxID=673940 RepID=A0ACB6QRJ6_9PLEO|nr:CRAL/TRIO domain-containing protein [Lindgomyces ingoldianus]KAF2468912.1 CRAL/TRIO domain-containing protein [Lindgomyces ingoldianus]
MATAAVEPAPTTTEPTEKILLVPSAANDASSEAQISTVDSKSIREGNVPPSPEENVPVTKPFEHPEPACKPAAPVTLTTDQQSKYDELLKTAKSWETLPKTSTKNAEQTPILDEERMWLTRECLLRYLRASKWHLAQATTRLHSTLIWRREYGTDTFTADYISEENATGKQVILGYDNEGRPCLYLLPNKQNTKNSPKQVEHLVFMLERTLEITPPGQETLALLVDFRNSSAGSNPSVGTGRQVLNILQNHYPERLGRALITHLPWYVTTFLKLISPFIDPVTKTKMRYNEPLTDHIPASQLMKNAGGDVDFEYNHEVYWPTLNALADERRKARKARWESAGKCIGESEIYLWGGGEKSVGAMDEEVIEAVQGLAVKEGEGQETKAES